jgi:integrase
VAKSRGLDLRFHDLRHTHATQLMRANVATKVVSERLGHASTSITSDIYSHVMPDMQEAAVEKLDAALSRALAELG